VRTLAAGGRERDRALAGELDPSERRCHVEFVFFVGREDVRTASRSARRVPVPWFWGPGRSKNSHLDYCLVIAFYYLNHGLLIVVFNLYQKIESQRTHISKQTLDKLTVMYTCASILGRGLLDLGAWDGRPSRPPPGPALLGYSSTPISKSHRLPYALLGNRE
jgi:hypothetical protein